MIEEDEELRLPPGHLVDKFYRGTIIKLRRGTQSGLVRSAATGRVLQFAFLHIRLVGHAKRFEDLREGTIVGYDVSWTMRGQRISVLWVPERPPVPTVATSVTTSETK